MEAERIDGRDGDGSYPLDCYDYCSIYSAICLFLCFTHVSFTLSKPQTCPFTWCCPGHAIAILHLSKNTHKTNLTYLLMCPRNLSFIYAFTNWHPIRNWYPEISGMYKAGDNQEFLPIVGGGAISLKYHWLNLIAKKIFCATVTLRIKWPWPPQNFCNVISMWNNSWVKLSRKFSSRSWLQNNQALGEVRNPPERCKEDILLGGRV